MPAAHVADELDDVWSHTLGDFATNPVKHHADDFPHRFANVGGGVLEVGDRLHEQRLGLGVGFLVKGRAGAKAPAPTEKLRQSVQRVVQALGRVLGGAGSGLTCRAASGREQVWVLRAQVAHEGVALCLQRG